MTDLWKGRFATGLDPKVRAFTASLDLDKRIALHDVRGSIAHARMLGRQRILPAADVQVLVAGLETIAAELRAGTFPWPDGAEYAHSACRQVLADRRGAVCGALPPPP